MIISNIIKGLSRASSFKSLRIDSLTSYASDNSAYNLISSSYELNKYANSLVASSYSHHIKFNNSKLDEEMIQIENQLKNLSSFVSKIPLFEEESIFFHPDNLI